MQLLGMFPGTSWEPRLRHRPNDLAATHGADVGLRLAEPSSKQDGVSLPADRIAVEEVESKDGAITVFVTPAEFHKAKK